MNVLVLGSGGREHALAWKIAQSATLNQLYIAPGNGGTAILGENLALSPTDFSAVADFCAEKAIDYLVVGPEDPLVRGIVNHITGDPRLSQCRVIGPDREAAQLEGSKEFAKAFMQQYSIPTAAYRSFGPADLQAGLDYLSEIKAPYVLKADGLAAGKGVVIHENLEAAQRELREMLAGKFGTASQKVVIEEFLSGPEYSVFVLTDGTRYAILPAAGDYKRRFENDQGLNTGGMGAVSPLSFLDQALWQRTEEEIIKPTIAGLRDRGYRYRGFLFFGLVNTPEGPKVIEYNVRMGDPETQVVMPLIENDLLALFDRLFNPAKPLEIDRSQKKAVTVVAVSEGYPGAYPKGKAIEGLAELKDVLVFHAGTRKEEGKITTSGGRVLAITALADSLEEARAKSYRNMKRLCFDGISYREDIGLNR